MSFTVVESALHSTRRHAINRNVMTEGEILRTDGQTVDLSKDPCDARPQR